MATIDFPIRSRWSGEIMFAAKIEADETSPMGVKIGLAVKRAIGSGAYLSGANLLGANLSRADLSGAKVRDEPVARVFASVSRLCDPYTFFAFELETGGVKILAGCRWFAVAEFVAHVAKEYPDTEKAAETLAILDFIQARAKSLGINLVPAKTVEP